MFGNPETGIHLTHVSGTPIKRQIRVRSEALSGDPGLLSYLERREAKKAELRPAWRLRQLAKRRRAQCPNCHDILHNGEEFHVHHVVPKSRGGGYAISNLALIHLYCYQQTPKGSKVKL